MSNTMWKAFERQIATWFGTKRNPLSGRNNYADDGERRVGDIVCPTKLSALVECKTRKTYPKECAYSRAEETCKEATNTKHRHWFHFERKNGSKKIYILATSEEWMQLICQYIREELERKASSDTDI